MNEEKPGSTGDRIITALDVTSIEAAAALTARLSGHCGAFKLGLEFLYAAGPQGVREVQAAGAERIFLDVKLHDIPNTVAGAVRSLLPLRPWMINVHAAAGGAALAAARDAAYSGPDRPPLLIGVTILTSLDQADLEQIGFAGPPAELAPRLAALCLDSGLDGVVASPLEAAAIRKRCGDGFLIVTPGIRPSGGDPGDQKRMATPQAALRAGATHLVIGRPITSAPDPAAAARDLAAEF